VVVDAVTWVRSGLHVDVALLARRVDDGEVGVELSTSLSRHSPRRPLFAQSVAAVQFAAVLEPLHTPRPRPLRRRTLLLLLFRRFRTGHRDLQCLLLMLVMRLFVLVRLRSIDVKRC